MRPLFLAFMLILVLLGLKKIRRALKWMQAKPRFDGKVVFITGGSSGIGEQLCKRFVQLGAKHVVIAARRVSELERVKKESDHPDKVSFI
jgi:NADP-dependent 3-hydroxy acid dehydrogenase YdfG